jgi:hypothetical protein
MFELLTRVAEALENVRAALVSLNERVTALEKRPAMGVPPLYVSLPEQDRSAHVDIGARVDSRHSGL